MCLNLHLKHSTKEKNENKNIQIKNMPNAMSKYF